MSKKAVKVLCLFDYLAKTGFGTVSTNIMERLEKEMEGKLYFDIIAINYFGQPVQTKYKNIWSATAIDGKKDLYGRNEFLNMLNNIDYDLVFIINDLAVINPMIEVMEKIKADKRKAKRKLFKTIFYFPVDAPFITHEFTDYNFSFYDVLIPYTQFAKNEVVKVRPELQTKMNVILHGVNTKDFMQVSGEDATAFRMAYFGEKNFDRYIIGNVNRNQPRKDIPTTIFAFDQYRKEHDPNALLYLHMNPKDEMGHDLRFICKQLGLVENEHVMFPTQELIEEQPEPKFLCMVYNALDVFLTTTTGEGFGLTVLEAMRCGCPVIAPYSTSFMEMYKNEDETENYLPLWEFQLMAQHMDNVVREQCSVDEVCEALYALRTGPGSEKRLAMSANAQMFATSLDWDIIVGKWVDVFRKLM